MDLTIEFSGDVVERQELLNGTQIVTLEGASVDGEWMLVGGLSWNVGLVDYAGEGDITLTRSDGAEVFGTLALAVANEIDFAESDEAADHRLRLEYEIDGGSGAFEGVEGRAVARGELSGETFRGIWEISLNSVPR